MTATNTIYRLQNDLGQWVDSQADISQLLTNAFRGRFESAFSNSRTLDLSFIHKYVTPQDTTSLLAPVSDAEIKAAFFDINPYKAPRSDGFGSKFFQTYWHIIHKDICVAIRSFFFHGKLPPSLNHTIITLIPKRENPSSPYHFRPISLINTIYKAISKILVQRLCPILQREISPFQNAFTKDRSIHDNLLVAQEILNTFHKSKNRTGWCALKLDMEKAYDRVEWDFLWQCLHAMGFPAQWVQWVQECVSNVSYSVKVNGHTTQWFRPTRGLRQGDPLSPYLFILCMEAFVMQLSITAASPGSGIGFKLQPNTPTIPCLLFADDCLLLCKATSAACNKLKSHIDDFCTLSGQLVNFHKSAIIFSKQISASRKSSLASHFNMLPHSSLGRYLGVYFSSYTPTKMDYATILQKTEQRIQHWEVGFLSKGGRHTLIQTNLEALPSYLCSSCLLPASTAHAIDRLHRQFFWRQQKDKNATPLIAWDTICQPKSQGGLGLRKTLPLNQAFIAKLGWKILTDHNNFWVNLVRKRYLKHHNFFTYKPKQSDSSIWRNIMMQRDIIRKGIRWKIGNGHNILFWLDNWLTHTNLLELTSRAPAEVDLTVRLSHFIRPNGLWDWPKLQALLPSHILTQIKGIPLPATPTLDTPVWGLTSHGDFTVKSATWLAHNIATPAQCWPFKLIWKLDLPPKLLIFLWQLCHSSLGVRSTLHARQILPFATCALCSTNDETIDHLFRSCPLIQQLWQLPTLRTWLGFSLCQSPLLHSLQRLKKHPPHVVKLVFLLWSIWKERNDVIFNQQSLNIHRILHKAQFLYTEWSLRLQLDHHVSTGTPFSFTYTSSTQSSQASPATIQVRWQPPPAPSHKLNFDGSVKQSSAAAGVIIRDSNGQLLTACAYNLGSAPVFVAEATALQQGIILALQKGISTLHIEGDNMLVINSVLEKCSVPWQIDHLIRDIRVLLGSFSSWTIRHIYREANQAADWVANVGHLLDSPFLIESCTNSALQTILVNDILGPPLVRRVS